MTQSPVSDWASAANTPVGRRRFPPPGRHTRPSLVSLQTCGQFQRHTHTIVAQRWSLFVLSSLFKSQLVVLLDPVKFSEMAVQAELMRKYFQSVFLLFDSF